MTAVSPAPAVTIWGEAIVNPGQAFPLTPLTPTSGHIPAEIAGSLYRNGPGRQNRGEMTTGHWFDGDGAILGVHFKNGAAQATYQYVQTRGYLAEAKANRYLYPNYGMAAPGPCWNTWGKLAKNAANTSVLALPDQLLALWEGGGSPYALDLETLETQGIENFGALKPNEPFSAHPKIDPVSGEIFNFGMMPGFPTKILLYRHDVTGKLLKRGDFILKGTPLVHDVCLVGPYLVFLVPPVRINLLSVISGFQPFKNAMQWQPDLGTEIYICDRESLTLVAKGKTDPFFQWHVVNGYQHQDRLILEVARYPDFKTNQNTAEIAKGFIKTRAQATLWRLEIDPQTGTVTHQSELIGHGCEFPTVPTHQIGENWRYTFMSAMRTLHDSSDELFGAIATYDRETGQLNLVDPGENCYPIEPIFVPEMQGSDQGWLLTVVYDGNRKCSEVHIYESSLINPEPICVLPLPGVVPPGFHGTWREQRF
ncbi:MAG: carotenoid oxygenase family protein [Cyanobacteria bacterium P01_H01_bin.15]